MLLIIDFVKKMFKFLNRKSKQRKNNNTTLKNKEKISTNITKKEYNQITNTNVLRSEFNFLKYPFFDLSPSKKKFQK